MKKIIRNGALALMAAWCAAALSFADGETTLVSLSYLSGTYASGLTQTLSQKTDGLDEVYDAALKKLSAQSGQTTSSGWTGADVFQTLSFQAGETVTLSSGSGLMWYSGTGSAGAALIDVTAGSELAAGGSLTAGHRYLADQQTVVTASSASSCAAQGLWKTAASGNGSGQSGFSDVSQSDYWYDPVLWAVENGVTTGTSATTFSPNGTCTRAQIVTFLWRSEGSPEPSATVDPFTDVASGQYYEKAVLWAVENGVTTGTSDTTFSPDQPCNRAQAVTFLWRSKGEPEPSAVTNPFTDVQSGQYYTKAVLWAVENGVTTGTGKTTFSPGQTCIRGQIVTFLYRVYAK
jgi:hypothetical protein